jgi:hypothetical protein
MTSGAVLAAYGAKAAERFVRSDRLEDAVAEMHEGMRHFARDTGLKIGREAAERALLLGLSTMPEEVVEWYARGGWRGRLEPYVAYWTEDEKLARRAGEAGWEVRQIQRPVSFEEGVPKEWRTAYVVVPFGFDLSAVERTVTQLVDGAESGVARVRVVEWPVPEAYLWFVLRDRQPVREGEWITAYSIAWVSVEEPLSRFREALRGRNFDEMRKAVWELYEARFNRTLWQIVYEFDRERAAAALEYLRQRYGVSEGRLWERFDELFAVWLMFRVADEFEAYLRSGAGRRLEKEAFGELLGTGRWLPVEAAPFFWLRLVGDPEGGAEFRAAWVTAVNMWFERMAEPYTPKKPSVARRAVELFNAFVGAGFKYEELFPPPQKPEAAKPETAAKPEAVKPAEAVKPETKPAERPAVEVQRPEERGLRREAEKQAAKPEAVRPEAPRPAAEAVEVRGLRRGPRAPIADVIPEGVLEAVDYLLERFGFALDREAAFKAKSLVTAKVKARLEKVAVKEPEFAYILAEVAEHVLSSFGRLMASPDAARHVHEALFYHFEGYQTRDGELLFARIERTVRETVRKAEEAGIPNAEYRIKQFILEVIDVLATAGERYRRDALKAVSTVEKALRATAFAGLTAAALYSVYHGLYSEAVVSSVATAVAFAEVGQFREAVQYVQKAAEALYKAAREVFEKVKVTVQRLVELFMEAVARALAWIDEHKAYLFLMAAVAAGAVALATALDIWGLIELDKLAYAASLTPFVPAGVKEYSREEVFNILKNDPDPYERFKEIAREANRGKVKLAEPWESLRKLIMPKPSEEERLMSGRGAGLYSKYREDENYKRALFYAIFALEEAFSDYRSVLRKLKEAFDFYRKDVEEHEKVVQRVVGEEPFKKDMYVVNYEKMKELVKDEEETFKKALSTLRAKLNEYAKRYNLGDFLNVDEDAAKKLVEAERSEFPKFNNVNFGVKAYAALIAYREYALGRKSPYGTAAWHWLEVGGSAWLLYYAPYTAYHKAKKVKIEKPVTVEEMVAEALRRIFLKPGTGYYDYSLEKLTKSDKLALVLEEETKSKKTKSYILRLFKLEEGGELKELGVKLRIWKLEGSIFYTLELDARWREFFKQELEAGVKAAGEAGGRLTVRDRFPYMLGWIDSDVAITRMGNQKVLVMTTSHLWQLAETHALFGWSNIAVYDVGLTLEGPKPQFYAYTSLGKLDEAIRISAKSGWLKMLSDKAGLKDLVRTKSWEGLKQWVASHWDVVVDAAAKRLGEGVREELDALRNKLDDDKIAREAVGPVLLLIQAEKLGVDETTLRYFGAVASGAIDGDGYVSAASEAIHLTIGKHEAALLWKAALAAYGIKAKVKEVGEAFSVVVSGDDAVELADLYFLYGAPLLEGDDRLKNHKLAEAVELGAEGRLDIRWEGLRKRTKKSPPAADLIISAGGAAVKYNVYLRKNAIELKFQSTDRSRAELAARLLKRAGVNAEVKKEGDRDVWYVKAATDMLAAGREELRKALAEIVKAARKENYIDAGKAERWLEKLEKGRVLVEGWPKYLVKLDHHSALEIRFGSTDLNSIEREAQRLEKMGLIRGFHFSVKMPKEGRDGYVRILKYGLAYAAWLSVNGNDEQRELATTFINIILKRAEEASKNVQEKVKASASIKINDVYEKVKKIIEEGKAWGSQTLERFEKKVEVNGETYVVKGIGGEAVEEDRGGRKLLRLKIKAKIGRMEGEHIVNPVEREYTITYSRRGSNNAAKGIAVARADAPGGREADAERFSALIKALTGREPRIRRRSDGKIEIECYEGHLEGFMLYKEFFGTIMQWLKDTSRRGRGADRQEAGGLP